MKTTEPTEINPNWTNWFEFIMGNPFKRMPTQIFFRKFGFGISLFGGWRFAWVKFSWNHEEDCWSASITAHSKK